MPESARELPDHYGEHLRRVVDDFRKNAPLSEHRAACKCARCKKDTSPRKDA